MCQRLSRLFIQMQQETWIDTGQSIIFSHEMNRDYGSSQEAEGL